jgi:chemotaxis protein methyltransferase CheR
MNQDLTEISRGLSRQGWDIRPFDETFLQRSLENRLSGNGLASVPEYAALLAEDKLEARAFYDSLHNSYSEFFREPFTFACLEQAILPGLLAEKKKRKQSEVRIWSAGCAAGQEAYSLAILMEELLAHEDPPGSYRIIATDICPQKLEAGRQGMYAEASMKQVRLNQLKTFFAANGTTWQVMPCLRERVDFSVYDLLDENTSSPPAGIYSDFDLVLCCNLLIYYRPETRRFIINRLLQSLAPGGLLVTGQAEQAMLEKMRGLDMVSLQPAIFKRSGR